MQNDEEINLSLYGKGEAKPLSVLRASYERLFPNPADRHHIDCTCGQGGCGFCNALLYSEPT